MSFRYRAGPKVKIYAGDEKGPFLVSKDVLAHFSPYFAACFNGFKESVDGVLRLEDEKPKFVTGIIDYFYDSSPDRASADMAFYGGYPDMFESVRFCDRYDICEAASIATEYLKFYEQHSNDHIINDYIINYIENLQFAFDRLHCNAESTESPFPRSPTPFCEPVVQNMKTAKYRCSYKQLIGA